MTEYYTQNVEIVIGVGSNLYNRIQQAAENENVSFEDMVNIAVQCGVYHHMNAYLDWIERSAKISPKV